MHDRPSGHSNAHLPCGEFDSKRVIARRVVVVDSRSVSDNNLCQPISSTIIIPFILIHHPSPMSLPPFLLAEPAPISPIPSQARLKALYASTSTQKLSNSTGYAANLSWWTSVLDSTLASGHLGSDRLIITVNNDLLSHFENNDGSRPKGLGGVVVRILRVGRGAMSDV